MTNAGPVKINAKMQKGGGFARQAMIFRGKTISKSYILSHSHKCCFCFSARFSPYFAAGKTFFILHISINYGFYFTAKCAILSLAYSVTALSNQEKTRGPLNEETHCERRGTALRRGCRRRRKKRRCCHNSRYRTGQRPLRPGKYSRYPRYRAAI